MANPRTLALTALAMAAFAANSLLCRIALRQTGIDAASFTTIRLVSGAATLWLIVRSRRRVQSGGGNWGSAAALFVYAAGFSFAYISLPASTGALLLFGAVQATMIGYGFWRGERLRLPQLAGLALAIGGLALLLLPGLSAPPLAGALLMLGAGMAWGLYSLRGRGAGDPTRVTAGNFIRAAPLAVVLSLVLHARAAVNPAGIACALLSGALASGIGYALWYSVLPALKSMHAATVQLSVPILVAIGGIFFLGEAFKLRLMLAAAAILGGIALVIFERHDGPATAQAAPATD